MQGKIPVPPGGEGPDIRGVHSYGQRFDAVGLFVQWLGESVGAATAAAPVTAWTIEVRVVPPQEIAEVWLVVSLEGDRGVHQRWEVAWLNTLLEGGRGYRLRQEIERAVGRLRSDLGL